MNIELIRGSAQERFYNSKKRFCAFIAAPGAGKTFTLCAKLIKLGVQHQYFKGDARRGLVVSTNYPQLKDNLIPVYKSLLTQLGYKFKESLSRKIITTDFGEVFFRSAEEPIIGFQCGYVGIDEATFIEADRFIDIDNRFRTRGSSQFLVAGTPESKKQWVYQNFVVKPLPNSEIFNSPIYENAKHLDKNWLANRKSVLPKVKWPSYIYGQYSDFHGMGAYSEFNPSLHVTDNWEVKSIYHGRLNMMDLDPTIPIILSCDFGTIAQAMVVLQKSEIFDCHYIRVIDEIYKTNQDLGRAVKTSEMIEEFVQRYGNRGFELIIHGDRSGHSEQSAADYTDYETILQSVRPHFRNVVLDVPTSNGRVMTRIGNVNSALKADWLKVHPRCTNLIEDLIAVKLHDDGKLGLLKSGEHKYETHISDALCYAINRIGSPLQMFNREVGFGQTLVR